MRQHGFASLDYLGTIVVVGIMLAGLTALRPREVRGKNPVDVLPPIIKLLGVPLGNLEPKPTPPRRSTPTPRPRRPPAPPRDRRVVHLPDWWR